MARTRKYINQYGGEVCGYYNGTATPVPALTGVHLCVDETHPGPPYRSGGPLLVTKRKISYGRTDTFTSHYDTAPNLLWSGYFAAKAYIPTVEPVPTPLSGWGAKGWNRTFPLHPIYQLGVSLVELKDAPGMLLQTKRLLMQLRSLSLTRIPRTVQQFLTDVRNGTVESSGHYLNLQFGWVPVIQDLIFLSKMRQKLSRKLAWLKKQNKKAFRRRVVLDEGGFSEDIPRVLTERSTMVPPLNTFHYAGAVTSSFPAPVRKDVNRKIWFVAKYRFYIPELSSNQVNLRDFSRLQTELLGLALDPTILYKVTPWSWLVDWFTSSGAVVQNIYLRARYHVVAEYAYVMCSESLTYVAPGHVTVHTGRYGPATGYVWTGGDRRLNGVTQTKYEFRQREVANPYGFGITFASLSAYQWSILAALGLSRRGKHSAPRT
jgi:hypothetical protein